MTAWHMSMDGRYVFGEVTSPERFRPVVVIDPVAITGPDETGEDGDPLTEIASCLRRLAEADEWTGSYRRRVAERLAEAFDPTPPEAEEPAAVGSLVVDVDGEKWVRHVRGEWSCLHSSPGRDVCTWEALCDQYGPIEVVA